MKTSHAVRGTAALLLVAFQMNLALPAASAHAKLLEATPSAGQSISTAAPAVTLRFDEPLQAGSTVAVTGPGPAADTWTTGPAKVSGSEISTDLAGLGPAGEYTVTYRVTSADGHVVTGSTYFTFTGSDGASRPGPAAEATATRGPGSGIPVLGIVGLVAVGAAVGLVALRRRRPGSES